MMRDVKDIEQPMEDIYVGDELSKQTASSIGDISPECGDVEVLLYRSLPKRLSEHKFFFMIGLLALLLASIPVLIFSLNNFAAESGPASASVAIVNDMCLNAINLEPGSLPFPATTLGAKREDDDDVENCGLEIKSGGGIWFKTLGTGFPFKLIKDDEQSFTNQVSVYQGECGKLKCVAGDNLRGDVLWDTLEEEQYYILVSGINDAAGKLHILLEDISQIPDETAVNDQCGDSIALATDGSVSTGNTAEATFDMAGAGTCYRTSQAGKGLWYDVIGSGRPLKAYTNDTSTSLAVFAGHCDKLECIASSNDNTRSFPSVQWDTLEATRYFILAHGSGLDKGSPFEISVTSDLGDDKFVINDFCKGAVGPVPSDGSILKGSTQYATLDRDGAGSCYDASLTG
jgi:hypothetical protein